MDITTLAAAKAYTDKQVQENRHALTDEEKQEIADMIEIPESGGTSDYTELTNKPKINGVELNGDLTPAELGIVMGGGEWEVLIDETLTEPATFSNNTFDKTRNEYILSVFVPKSETSINSANSSFMGASGLLYYRGLSNSTYNMVTMIYVKMIDDDAQLQTYSTAFCGNIGVAYPNTYAGYSNNNPMATFQANRNHGVTIPATLPITSRVRLIGR